MIARSSEYAYILETVVGLQVVDVGVEEKGHQDRSLLDAVLQMS